MYQYTHGLFLPYFDSTMYDYISGNNKKIIIKYYSWFVALSYFIHSGKRSTGESDLQVIQKKWGKAWTGDSWSEKEVILEATRSGNQKNPHRTQIKVCYI